MAVVGQDLAFAIPDDESSLVTQKVTVTHKVDKKEAKDKSGIVIAVAYYNQTDDVSIEGLGLPGEGLLVGSALSLSNTSITLVGLCYIDEITIDLANEDWVKTSIKATAYSGISA